MKRFVFALMAIAFVCLTLAGQPRLIWQDEFNGKAGEKPDASRWVHDLGAGGWGNKELQSYTDLPQNAQRDGRGSLVIRAVKEKDGSFTSARLKTLGKFQGQYLKVVARMKVPRGQGLWPAFWMLGVTFPREGWPNCGEIDIMEHIGKEPNSAYGTVHGPGYSGKDGISGKQQLPKGKYFGDEFHEFAVEWRPSEIVFTVDSARFHTVRPKTLPAGTPWVFNRPFFLILNLAVGGEWPGYPDKTTVFPAVFTIDWIRVYQLEPIPLVLE